MILFSTASSQVVLHSRWHDPSLTAPCCSAYCSTLRARYAVSFCIVSKLQLIWYGSLYLGRIPLNYLLCKKTQRLSPHCVPLHNPSTPIRRLRYPHKTSCLKAESVLSECTCICLRTLHGIRRPCYAAHLGMTPMAGATAPISMLACFPYRKRVAFQLTHSASHASWPPWQA